MKDKKQIIVRMTEAEHTALKMYVAKNKTNMNTYILNLIKKDIKQGN